MKKIVLVTLALFGILLFNSCTSSMLFSAFGPASGYGFRSASSNPLYGYEGFAWGTSLETIKEKTQWYISGSGGNYFIGVYGGWDSKEKEYWPHGGKDLYVDKTTLHFIEEVSHDGGKYLTTLSKLYAAEDEYKKTPPMEFLHRRYGQFSEENLAGAYQKSEGIVAIYRTQKYLNIIDLYEALEIVIYADGKTLVKMREPFFLKSRAENDSLDTWFCYSALQKKSSETRINFTFLNQNKDGKYLFIGYSKGYEQPNISYVRSGICWGDNASGAYDIKGDSNALSKNCATEKWNCAFNGEDYIYTNVAGQSARDLLELVLASKKISVRHNNVVSEFNSDGKQLLDKMAEYDITWEELDAALANEEF